MVWMAQERTKHVCFYNIPTIVKILTAHTVTHVDRAADVDS